MEVVEGTIGQMSSQIQMDAGERQDKAEGRATLSGIEIGHRQLQRVVLTERLSKALESGEFARVLIWRGLTQGLVTRPFVAAIEVDGVTYRADRVLPMVLLKILLWMILVVGIGSVSPELGVFVAACIIGYYVKNCVDFLRFGHD